MCRSMLKSCRGVPEYSVWEERLRGLLTRHPEEDGDSDSESGEESQLGDRSSSEPPPSLPSSGE